MEKYKEHQWGEYHISEVHLSQRFVYDTNGYYRSCNSIPFPEIPSRALTPESWVIFLGGVQIMEYTTLPSLNSEVGYADQMLCGITQYKDAHN